MTLPGASEYLNQLRLSPLGSGVFMVDETVLLACVSCGKTKTIARMIILNLFILVIFVLPCFKLENIPTLYLKTTFRSKLLYSLVCLF